MTSLQPTPEGQDPMIVLGAPLPDAPPAAIVPDQPAVVSDRGHRLQRLAAALAGALDARAVGRAILDVGIAAAQADAGGILLRDGERLTLLEFIGVDAEILPPARDYLLTQRRVSTDAVRSRRPIYLASSEEWARAYPEIAPVTESQGYRATASIPLDAGDAVLGVLVFNYARPRSFPADERAFLETIGTFAAQSLARALLHESERAARRSAEVAARRAERLRDLTAALAEHLAPADVASAVVKHARQALQGHGGVLVLKSPDGRMLRLAAADGYEPSELQGWAEFPIETHVPIADCVRRGVPLHIGTFEERAALYPDLAPVRGHGASLSVPLVVGGEAIGALGLTFDENAGGDYVATDTGIDELSAVANQCAIALERARLFEAEQRARNDAERANRAKMDFLAAMSHELRTPLNAIDGHAELLEMGVHGPITEPQLEALRRIRRSEAHLLGLINDVLNFAKLEAGSVSYELRPIPVWLVVRETAQLLMPRIDAAGLSFTQHEPDEGVQAFCDEEKLAQILLNLFSNAIKFTPPGGRIEVHCASEIVKGARMAVVRVSDTGEGIPSEKLDVIFEPFVQIGRALSAPREGTGLGLAISRGLARAMGGDLTVTSETTQGSEFTLTLPSR